MAKVAPRSITVKLVVTIVLVSILLTVLSSLIQLYFLLRLETTEVESHIDFIHTTYMDSIARSVWTFDEALLESQLNSIQQLPDIELIELRTNLSDIYRKGRRISNDVIEKKFDVIFRGDREHNLGTLRVVASKHLAFERVKSEVGFTLLAESIKISCTALIILLIIHKLITIRLTRVSEYTASMSLEKLTHDSELYRNLTEPEDEISDVVVSLNQMRQSIKYSVATLNKAYDKLHESEQKFKSLVNNIPGAIYRCHYDKRRKMVFMSDAVMQITGHSKYEFLNQDLTVCRLLAEEHVENVNKEINRAVKESRSYRLEYKIFDANNNEKWLYDCGAGVKGVDNKVDYLDGVLFDITDKKLLEQSLQQFNEQLEIRVEKRTEELEHANQELTSAQSKLVESEKMASLGGMVAGIAHEINTPVGVGVTAVSHLITQTNDFFETLKEGKLTRSQFEHHHKMTKEGLDIISRNLSRVAALIKSFKMVAVDQSSQERRIFVLCDYLEDIVLTLKPKLKAYRHELIIKCPNNITIDSFPSAFYQIFSNLIMNSLSHGFETIEKGKMEIHVMDKEDTIEMTYIDNGVGMNEHTLKEVFNPFFTTSRHRGGSGLGMHIVYNLVSQILKGDITCESALNEGVKVKITFPLSH
ncbi:MAG: ATP-binding protein [Pseudomonadota bacterium]